MPIGLADDPIPCPVHPTLAALVPRLQLVGDCWNLLAEPNGLDRREHYLPRGEREPELAELLTRMSAVDLVIVLDNNHLKFKIDQQIKEINETLGRETVVYFMQKPQGVTANSTDEYSLVQEYFKGKNHRLMQNQELIKKKI